MEGARILRVEARRPDLRVPFPPDFVERLTGQTITGLGRRAKYLLADVSGGDESVGSSNARPKIVMLLQLCALTLKVPLTALFVFGAGPVPAMGAPGATIALDHLTSTALSLTLPAGALLFDLIESAEPDVSWSTLDYFTGIVEQLSLRTTVIRALNGDRTYVPNSQIIAASSVAR